MVAKDAVSRPFITFAKVKGIFLRFIGCVITGFFGLCILIGFFGKPEKDVRGLIFCLFGMVIGIIVLICGNRTLSTVKRCRRYAEIISGQNEADVHNFAGVLSQPVDFVIGDLQKMISKGLLVGVHLDRDTQKITFDNRPIENQTSPQSVILSLKYYPISSIAWIMLCFFTLLSVSFCIIDFPGRFIAIIMGSIGMTFSIVGTKFRPVERQWKYIRMIGKKKERDINRIAKLMRCPVDEAMIELKEMIAKGLMNVQIDEEKKQIFFTNPAKNSVPGSTVDINHD
jgi:hypothetical protein